MSKSFYLAESHIGKLFKGEQGLFPADVFTLFPPLVLGLVNPAGRQGGDAHAVADEDDHVLGKVSVHLVQGLQGSVDLILSDFFPVIRSCVI